MRAGVTLLGAVLTYFTYTTWGRWVCKTVPLMVNYMKLAPMILPPLFVAIGLTHFVLHKEYCRFYPHQVRVSMNQLSALRTAMRTCLHVRLRVYTFKLPAPGFVHAGDAHQQPSHTSALHLTLTAVHNARTSLQGAWGFWYLPGDPSFHVNWTGIAEIAGGVGCFLGSQNIGPSWLLPASAFGLFLLTAVVSPSNIYMWTHNAAPLTDAQLDALPGGALDWKVHVVRGAVQVVLLATYLGLALHNY